LPQNRYINNHVIIITYSILCPDGRDTTQTFLPLRREDWGRNATSVEDDIVGVNNRLPNSIKYCIKT